MYKKYIGKCGFYYTLGLISSKYKMSILYLLSRHKIIRYNELKSLTKALKKLESDDLIIRTEYPQIPPKVEYSLSKRGESLIPILDLMCKWGVDNKKI